jgi:hypothetical protein
LADYRTLPVTEEGAGKMEEVRARAISMAPEQLL